MRIIAILFIVLSVAANFFFNNMASLLMAMFSFPVLLWVLLKKRKKLVNRDGIENTPQKQTAPEDRLG